MTVLEQYKNKLTTAAEAVKCIKDGDWVDYGWCTGTPVELDKALAARAEEFNTVNVRGGMVLHPLAIAQVENPGEHFTYNSWHMTGIERKYIDLGEDFAFYNPMRYSELPKFYRQHIERVNVAMFQVGPMDKFGFFNYGPNNSHMKDLVEKADIVIVEVNENMPRCLGGWAESVHIDDIDMIVEGENPPMDIIPDSGEPSDVDKKVAEFIMEELQDGNCLQMGIGGMVNAVGKMIAESDLQDLSVHTEMFIDCFVDIAEQGKITGKRKNIDPLRMTYGFGAGTQKMYDFLDNNPACMSVPIDYVNDTIAISQLDNFISINNAVDCDIFGQINAETNGTKHIGGAGGQLDFVLGAYRANNGKSFICMSSTFKNKKTGETLSRIRPTLKEGSIVTDTRSNIDFLVTEYGKVRLKGCSTWQKAEKIISCAHPDFRDDLIKDAEAMKIWRRSNKR
jgi:butyryl-CoA:acetate CoA-transferase